MAGHLVFIFFSFSLVLIPTYGRNLQKNYIDETIASSKHSFSSIKIKAFSHATNTYTGKTNYSDVLGMAALVDAFPQLNEANDDPCLTPKWTWIECNSDPSPRVIALHLSSRLLLGFLPDFSTMDALQTIDLSQNSLIGTIPSFLGTFPNLQELNLAFNIFTGLVPDSLACNKDLKLTLTGNSGLYTSSSCSKSNPQSSPTSSTVPISTTDKNNDDVYTPYYYTTSTKKNNSRLIIGITVPLLVIFNIAIGIFAIYRHKAKTAAAVAAAAASAPSPGPDASPSDPKHNTPGALEERPINPRN